MATDLRSFKHDEEVRPGTIVWYRDGNHSGSPVRLAKVLGAVDSLLVVQIGPDPFKDEHLMVRTKWSFYEATIADLAKVVA